MKNTTICVTVHEIHLDNYGHVIDPGVHAFYSICEAEQFSQLSKNAKSTVTFPTRWSCASHCSRCEAISPSPQLS